MTVLILGGTAEARALARVLVGAGWPVVSSLAGRVSAPALPVGEVRIGGFGGVAGLVRFITQRQVGALVDATHPFAVQMTRNAQLAATATGCPLLRLARPGWSDHPRARAWTWVADACDAVTATNPRHPFLTTGRQSLEAFLPWSDREVVVRVVEPPEFALPDRWRVIRSRGPYLYDLELRLMRDHRIDLLVTKDSGGSWTRAKLDAAWDLGIPVVIIARPELASPTTSVSTVEEARDWVFTVGGRPAAAGRHD